MIYLSRYPILPDRDKRQRRWRTHGLEDIAAYITGSVDQELLRNEYLVTENRLLRNQMQGRVRLTDGERKTLAEIGQRLGRHALAEIATIVKPDTILAWHRKLVAQNLTVLPAQGPRPSADRCGAGGLVVCLAKENRRWGYDRIAGALAHLGTPSVTRRWGISSAP